MLNAIRRPEPSLSFEFYPPRDGADFGPLAERASRLTALGADFVSVTYGAGGGAAGRREASARALAVLATVSDAPRLAHLTLAGHSRDDLTRIIGQFLADGAEGFMALRGDPPGGSRAQWQPTPGGLTYASELVALVRELTDQPIGVAAFPHGHPSARSLAHDADVLARKQAAGADFALSQVVLDAGAYFGLVERARQAGASLPIVPGIMPLSRSVRRERLELFSGAPLPRGLAELLDGTDDLGERDRAGLDWTVDLVRELLAGGAPGVHFYTVTSSAATEAVCLRLGFKSGDSQRHPK
jgi:methylenetetrahydrofolate reductase (NADPH)